MIMPRISLNGTDPNILTERLSNAIEQLEKAIEVMLDIYPNGRDYVTTEQLRIAEKEYRTRTNRLRDTAEELKEYAIKLDDLIGQ